MMKKKETLTSIAVIGSTGVNAQSPEGVIPLVLNSERLNNLDFCGLTVGAWTDTILLVGSIIVAANGLTKLVDWLRKTFWHKEV